ncbi:mycofactocin system transcriptional regulator [Nocardia jiangxiensis]|uniref:Mycofactocin system transcriptional regulator n=1 Tax=Nocardia jiangxiensis TaxID=282685 RepID=A0ABW6RUZ6_9NOCA|nr:mycofactocin system transcriptional regulator [Nocardia jiangxiensis]
MSDRVRKSPGRPPATDHGAIEAVAFRLFAERGFDATSLDDIAAAVGVGRRTLFRYYKSKNDIPWGQFDASLVHLAGHLDDMPEDVPVHEAVQRAVIEFNRLDPDAVASHRQRMRLILATPALQAHSVLRYQQWRAVITSFVARRFGLDPGDLLPRTAGQVTLALALSAYEQWLEDADSSLDALLAATLSALKAYLAAGVEDSVDQ